MKKPFLTLIVAFATICGFAQDIEPSKVDYYEVKGELKNVPDSTVLGLSRVVDNLIWTITTDTVFGGRFHFRIKPDSISKEELTLACFRGKDFPMMSFRPVGDGLPLQWSSQCPYRV